MGVQRDAVLIYKSFVKATKGMSDKDRLAYYDALFKYGLEGKKTMRLPPAVQSPFEIAMPIIDSNNKKYEAGKGGGRPSTKDLPLTKMQFIMMDTVPEEYSAYDFPKSWRDARFRRIMEQSPNYVGAEP